MPLKLSPWSTSLVAFALLVLAGCASRPINPPLDKADRGAGYRWQTRPQTGPSETLISNAALAQAASGVPDIEIFPIAVSFEALDDDRERDYLKNLTTTFALPDEAVDRLREAAGTIIREFPDFKRLFREMNGSVKAAPVAAPLEIR